MNTKEFVCWIMVIAVAVVSNVAGASASNAKNEPAKDAYSQLDKAAAGMFHTPIKCPTILVWDARTNANERILRRFQKINDPANRGPGLAVTTLVEPLNEASSAFSKAEKKLGENVSMVVVVMNGGVSSPRMSVFPEDRIGFVNVDRVEPLLYEKKVIREIWRAIGFTGGAGYAPYRGCVMQPVFSDKEIAGLMGDVLQLMTLQSFRKFEDRFDMKRVRLVDYEVACYQGWAPTPTNEAQRIIWDAVKEDLSQEPKKPILIEKKPR